MPVPPVIPDNIWLPVKDFPGWMRDKYRPLQDPSAQIIFGRELLDKDGNLQQLDGITKMAPPNIFRENSRAYSALTVNGFVVQCTDIFQIFPMTLTSFMINSQEFLSAPVVITIDNVFFAGVLTESPLSLPINSKVTISSDASNPSSLEFKFT